MSAALPNLLRRAARHRLQVNVWPVAAGFQVNVKCGPENSWSVSVTDNPIEAMTAALRRKLAELEPPSGEIFE